MVYRRKSGTKVKNKRQGPKTDPPQQKNAHFSAVVKDMYKLIQTVHHQAVLESFPENALPPALQRKKDELDRFWKPSSSNENVQAKFQSLSKSYMDAGIQTMKDHYLETSSILESKLKTSTLDAEGFAKAKGIAASWAKKNYRKKLSDTTLANFHKLCNQIAAQKDAPDNTKSEMPQENLASTSSKPPSDEHRSEAPATPAAGTSQGTNPKVSALSANSTPQTHTPTKRKRADDSPPSSPSGELSPSTKAPPSKQNKIKTSGPPVTPPEENTISEASPSGRDQNIIPVSNRFRDDVQLLPLYGSNQNGR